MKVKIYTTDKRVEKVISRNKGCVEEDNGSDGVAEKKNYSNRFLLGFEWQI